MLFYYIMLLECSKSSILHPDEFEVVLQCLLYYDYVSKYVSSLINFFYWIGVLLVGWVWLCFCFGLDLWAWVKIEIWCFLLKLLIVCDRMGTRCSSRSREAEKTYECLLWSTVGWLKLYCFSLGWLSPSLSILLMRYVFPSSFFMDSVQLLVLTWTFIFAVGNGGWGWNWCNASSDWRFCTPSISTSSPINVTELRKIYF